MAITSRCSHSCITRILQKADWHIIYIWKQQRHMHDSFLVTYAYNSDHNITIGFTQPSYTIPEDGESISVCLEVDVSQQQTGVITLQIITVDVTATGRTDNPCIFRLYAIAVSEAFISLTGMDDFMPVSSNLTVEFSEVQECITIPIFDDDVVENAERFTVEIISSDLAVCVTIPSTTVLISDCSGINKEYLDSSQLIFSRFYLSW